MKRGIDYGICKCRKDLNFDVDFRVNGVIDCDQMGCYFIQIMVRFHPQYIFFLNTHHMPLTHR